MVLRGLKLDVRLVPNHSENGKYKQISVEPMPPDVNFVSMVEMLKATEPWVAKSVDLQRIGQFFPSVMLRYFFTSFCSE